MVVLIGAVVVPGPLCIGFGLGRVIPELNWVGLRSFRCKRDHSRGRCVCDGENTRHWGLPDSLACWGWFPGGRETWKDELEFTKWGSRETAGTNIQVMVGI